MTFARKTMLSLLVLDFAATILVFNLVSHYRGITNHFIFGPLLIPAAILIITIYLIDGYRAQTDMGSLDYTSLHLIALLTAMAGLLLLTFVFIPAGYELQSSRGLIPISFLLLAPLTLAYRRMLYFQVLANRSERTIIFVGDYATSRSFLAECARMGVTQPVMCCAINAAVTSDSKTVLAGFADVLAEVQSGRISVEAIILRESSQTLAADLAQQLVQLYFRGAPTYTLELFHQVYWQKIPLYRLNPTWLFQEGFRIAREPVFDRLKRLSDIGLSSLGLLLAGPLIAIAGAAIWLEDRGPVFFMQLRIGKNRVPFRLLKLRTMKVAQGQSDPYTRPGDRRITRVGRVLRATRLDELPQLWNVWRGEMSLIGPRAEWDRLVDEYEREIACYNYRHLVKPGITGWAQVNYPYGANLDDTIRKLEYDLYYIRHFSFLLDASIVLKTIQIMLFGKGT